jgi:tetratricopeptide (TPR) repeat protein
MTFRTADLETHERAFQYLKDGAIFCEKYDFTEGKRWLSSAYYSFGASLATEGDYGKAIVPLEKSCSILEQDQLRAKTQSEQWSMQLCKRYELLGASHLKISNEKRAISALQCALVHLPKSSIKEFVRHCDTVSLTIIIDKLPLLPKLMERYLRAAIIDRPHDEITLASETMDIGHLNTSQQAIIKECELQIMNVMSLRTNVSTLQMRLIDDLLLSYEASQYPIRRARILVEKCRLLRSQTFSHQDSNDLSQIVIDEALALLKGDVFALDTDLLDYRKYHLAAGYSWNGICKQQDIQASTNSFEMALRCWGTILKPIPLLGEDAGIDDDARSYIYRQIDGVDRLYGHLRMLSDLFAVNQRRIQRIAVLRLLLQLNNGLRDKDSDNISDAVMMCTEISGTYLELGYTGKAAAEITRAEKIMKISKCSTEAKLHHLLMYAQYLTITGDVDKSAEVYQRAKELADQANPKRHFNKYKTTQNKLTRSTLLAGASFIRSYLSVELGSVDDAVNDTTTALKILSRLSSSIFQKSKSRREQPESLDNPFQSDTKRYENTVPEEQHSHGIVHTVAEIALLDANWSMAQKMSKCFARLGALHSARGSWREAEYFYKQGLQLSEHLGSKMATSAFLISLADLYWRTGKYQESQQRLEKASELQSMVTQS